MLDLYQVTCMARACPALQVTAEHVAALAVVGILGLLGAQLDRRLSSNVNRLNGASIRRQACLC